MQNLIVKQQSEVPRYLGQFKITWSTEIYLLLEKIALAFSTKSFTRRFYTVCFCIGLSDIGPV